jgi:prepilin-type N-terminal cleavage/methylation domain-containing protein
MASHKISTTRGLPAGGRGFTLIELLVVMGIISILLGLSLFVDLNSYRGDAFRAEVGALGVALQTARADALNNINEAKHGVAIHPGGYNGYVVFQGDNYAARNVALDVSIDASYTVTISPSSPTEVVFSQLSGNAVTALGLDYDGDITFTDPNRAVTAVITINHEGKISW